MFTNYLKEIYLDSLSAASVGCNFPGQRDAAFLAGAMSWLLLLLVGLALWPINALLRGAGSLAARKASDECGAP